MPHQILPVPTTVFTGFLGTGKTTLISHLIEPLQKAGIQVAYIKNEIGDTDIDTKVLQGENIQTTELLNGCICCTLVGPFVSAIEELVKTYKPDRIIIEASGAAEPTALALMINSHPLLTRDGIISVIDVQNFEGYVDLSVTAQRQTQFTDLIIFNKIETVPLERKRAVVGYVRELNTHAPIIEAPHGVVDTELVFGLTVQQLDSFVHTPIHADHLTADHFSAFTVVTHDPIASSQLQTLLENRPKEFFRAKGIFIDTSGTWCHFNAVGKKVSVEPLKPSQKFEKNIFVFIGQQFDQKQQDALTKQLQAL